MNRLPRHASRVRPPLRGRSATISPRGQTQSYSLPTVRQRSAPSGHPRWQEPHQVVRHDRPIRQEPRQAMQNHYPVQQEPYREDRQDRVHPVLLKLYRLWPVLFEVLDQPWKWLVALGVLIILSIGIGSLL